MKKQIAIAIALASALAAFVATPADASTITVWGDSNSTGHDLTLQQGYADARAYSAFMPNADLVDGWAQDGATSVGIRNHAVPSSAEIQLVMIGTNDLDHGFARDTTIANIETSVSRVGADQVVLLAVPPYAGNEATMASYNRRLKSVASAHGWYYFDGWWETGQKLTGSVWASGASLDGKHPTAAGYQAFGAAVDQYLVDTFGSSAKAQPATSKRATARPATK